MIFASTYPVSDDPTPYKTFPYDGPRTAEPQGVHMYDPRPEFDRPRAHEANPILQTFHTLWLHSSQRDGGKLSRLELFKLHIQQTRFGMERALYDTPERVHARKVLDRLDRMIGPVFAPETKEQ